MFLITQDSLEYNKFFFKEEKNSKISIIIIVQK